MTKTYYRFLLLLCCCWPDISTTQPAPGASDGVAYMPEHMTIHTDRQLYISGETIWFKVYVFDSRQGKPADFSKAAYLELISQKGIAISRVKVALNNGQGAGTIELPKALNNGNYVLRAYTQAMRNEGEASFCKSMLIILNPGQPMARATDASLVSTKPPAIVHSPGQDLLISIQTTETTFPQRSQIGFEITTKNAAGQPVAANLSVSIALPSPAAIGNTGFSSPSKKETSTAPSQITYAPEPHGLRLHGKVINQNTKQGEPNATVFLALPGKAALVYGATTDATGAFNFLLPKLYGLRQIVLQAQPQTTVPVSIELDDEFHSISDTNSATFVLPSQWESLAQTAMVNAQIGQAYEAFETQPTYTTHAPFATVPFFGKPDIQYLLDDYTRFPLPEFFFEVVTEVSVKGKFGSERLEVINDWEASFKELPPLLLVDGVPVFDQNAFLKLNNKLIASTEVVTSPFWLNPVIFNGVIQISSFESNAYSFVLPETALQRSYLTFLPERVFAVSDNSQTNPQLPDFRNTLFWSPSVQTDANGKAEITFFTSDALGPYDIQVRGVSETGLQGIGSSRITIIKPVLKE
ncbi:MAG: MG2 domain-containing protein [Saprospiraceae bacterium]